MPYKNIEDLPKQLESLPNAAKKIFLATFNSAFDQYNDEEKAFSVALGSVKKKYKKEGESWVEKAVSEINDFEMFCDFQKMAVVTIRPTSSFVPDPNYQHWNNSVVPSGTTIPNRYTLVNEAVADDDTSFFQCSSTTHSFEFMGMGATGITEGNISNVRAVFRCKYSTATGLVRAIVGTSTSAYSYGADKTETASYQDFTQDWTTNPRTGVAWVWSDFTNYYFGVEGWGNGTKATSRCTQFYLEITYSEPSAGIDFNGVLISKINGVSVSKINGV